MSTFEVAILAVGVGLVLLAGVVLHKVRRIHVASFRLLDLAQDTHRETLALFAQLQSLGNLERLLKLDRGLPPMRQWAGSPDFLLRVAESLMEDAPPAGRHVLECSSGVSTVVTARCLQIQGAGHVWSLEHEPRFAEATRSLLKLHGLEAWATVIDAPLRAEAAGASPWYSLDGLPADLPPVDVLVVDGPPAATAAQARFPALPRLESRLAARCTVFLDDAGRADETETARRWQAAFPAFTVEWLPCEKGLVVLRR